MDSAVHDLELKGSLKLEGPGQALPALLSASERESVRTSPVRVPAGELVGVPGGSKGGAGGALRLVSAQAVPGAGEGGRLTSERQASERSAAAPAGEGGLSQGQRVTGLRFREGEELRRTPQSGLAGEKPPEPPLLILALDRLAVPHRRVPW